MKVSLMIYIKTHKRQIKKQFKNSKHILFLSRTILKVTFNIHYIFTTPSFDHMAKLNQYNDIIQ